ncbi:hypothetical protein ACIQXD_05315 [Streptomyces uncialis]|uniref:hypothetical protein n=1 Tax=Streptomyces uncialis TaxID=1048205 RepID=UPI00380C1102
MPGERQLAAECAHQLHDICHGTYAVYVQPWTVPAVSGRCDCTCHTVEAGVLPEAEVGGGG